MLNNKRNICNIRNPHLLAIYLQCSSAPCCHSRSIVFSCMLSLTFCYYFCLQCLRVLILSWFPPIFSRRLRNFSLYKNIAMWINHTFYLIRLIFATWIVRGKIGTRMTVEIIVEATAGEIRTICGHRDGLWHNTCTLL